MSVSRETQSLNRVLVHEGGWSNAVAAGLPIEADGTIRVSGCYLTS